MSTLIVVGIVSGVITAISPCVLRVLPAILTSFLQDGARYRDDGLTTVGVHSPEFSFERVVPNVQDAADRYGITYPIAIDNDFTTCRAWDQRFWPNHYLIDQTGVVRHVHYGEGGYEETGRPIQELLDAPLQGTVTADPGNHTIGRTQEFSVGWQRLTYAHNTNVAKDERVTHDGNSTPDLTYFSFDGTWVVESERAIAGQNARLYLHFFAADVYLVLAGTGDVTVTLPSDLYDLDAGAPMDDVMTLNFSEGVEAFAFTFG